MATPATYPSRGTWSFYNSSRGLTFWMKLDTINITQAQANGGVAVLSGRVIDLEEDMVWEPEDVIVVKFGTRRIFAGHVKTVGDAWTDPAGLGRRVFDIEAQDYTAKLDDAIIRRRKDRKAETARRRAKWILSHMRESIQAVTKDLSGVPTGEYAVAEKANLFGLSVNDALTSLGDEVRMYHYVDFDDDEDGKPTVVVARNIDYEATIEMNNDTPDYVTSFPFREFVRYRDSVELGNAVLVEPKERKDSRWSLDNNSIAAYGRQERFVSDVDLPGPIAAGLVGERALAEYDTPKVTGSFVVHEPGIYSGMKFKLTEARHGITEEWYIVDSVDIVALDAHDADQTAFLKTTVNYTDRRKRGKSKKNRNAKGKGGTTADTTMYSFVDFQALDEITPPVLSVGSSAGAFAVAGQAQAYRVHEVLAWVLYPGHVDTNYEQVDFFWNEGRFDNFGAGLGGYVGHTSIPSWCFNHDGYGYCSIGHGRSEQWYKMTMGAHPANAGAITVECEFSADDDYGDYVVAQVVVKTGVPTAMSQGTVIGTLPKDTSATFSIPVELIPAEGEELYLGYRPRWHSAFADYPWEYGLWGPTYSKPQASEVTEIAGVPYRGYSGSGRAETPVTPTWNTWAAAVPTLGEASSDPEAPWEGGNTINDAGFEGAGDSWSIGSDGLTVRDDNPAGKGIYLQGNREEGDEASLPSSDVDSAFVIRFTIDAAGSTTDAGERSITATTTGEGEQATGIVHLGDSMNAAGISVKGAAESDYLAKAITVGVEHRAMFDTRSGQYVKGKLWLRSDKRPADWDVQALLGETDDELDRWMLWARAGNVGTYMGVTIHEVYALDGAVSGQRIVKEYIGRASGTTKRFYTAMPFRNGTLRVYVNGIGIGVAAKAGASCQFDLDFWPTYKSIMRATYVVR